MSEKYREIITKAVVAKGRKSTQCNHTITPKHHPSSILGCWIINHRYEAFKKGKTVEIVGSYDINVWYSFEKNTKTEVVTERVEYKDLVKLRYRDKDCFDDDEVIARVLQQPNCTECTITQHGNKIIVHVEREFAVDVVGETKVCVAVYPHRCDCNDDTWGYELQDDDFEDLNPDFLVGNGEE